MKKWIKRNLVNIILFGIMILGFALLGYPAFADWWNSFHQSRAIMSYTENVARMDTAEYERILTSAYAYNEEKGITKDKERVELIIRKTRLEYSIDSKRAAIGILKETVAKLEKVKYKKLNAKIPQTDILKGNYSIDDWKWMRADFESNPIYPEDLQFRTPLGTIVRTKSEWMIAMAFELLGIPYRYEQVHYIAGNVYYPDFTIRKQDGTIVIWEHFGLMEDSRYAKKAKYKIEIFQNAGFRQHTNFICTYEDDIKSQEDIENIIKRFYFV